MRYIPEVRIEVMRLQKEGGGRGVEAGYRIDIGGACGVITGRSRVRNNAVVMQKLPARSGGGMTTHKRLG